jgi:hypothetical protein
MGENISTILIQENLSEMFGINCMWSLHAGDTVAYFVTDIRYCFI